MRPLSELAFSFLPVCLARAQSEMEWRDLMPSGRDAPCILGVGAACLDLIWQVPYLPGEDTKVQAAAMLVQGGGPVATALVAATRLGLATAYCGTLGDDLAGKSIMEGLTSAGVDTSLTATIPGTASHLAAILVSQETGTRTVIWHPGSVPPPASDSLPDDALARVQFLHLDGHHPEAALALARRARRLGVTVSLDAGTNYPWLAELVPLVDILVASECFARGFTGKREPDAMIASLARHGPTMVGVTLGEVGGIVQARGERFTYPALPVTVVDTNGAGDVFHGAFLTGLALGLEPREASLLASAAAALNCTALGGRAGIPDLTGVLAFLATKGLLTEGLQRLAR